MTATLFALGCAIAVLVLVLRRFKALVVEAGETWDSLQSENVKNLFAFVHDLTLYMLTWAEGVSAGDWLGFILILLIVTSLRALLYAPRRRERRQHIDRVRHELPDLEKNADGRAEDGDDEF